MKPIETIFDGYKFRSRLEARWAVFFKTLGIEYRYEPEGYDLGGTWYLPDFWIGKWDSWVEIKPEMPSEQEARKCCELARATEKTCLLVFGEPWMYKVVSGGYDTGDASYQWAYRFCILHGNELDPYEDFIVGRQTHLDYLFGEEPIPPDTPRQTIIPTVAALEMHVFAECRRCSAMNCLELHEWVDHIDGGGYGPLDSSCCRPGGPERWPIVDTPHLMTAYTVARQARFEHSK